MIMRTQKPLTLRALSFGTISIGTFQAVRVYGICMKFLKFYLFTDLKNRLLLPRAIESNYVTTLLILLRSIIASCTSIDRNEVGWIIHYLSFIVCITS